MKFKEAIKAVQDKLAEPNGMVSIKDDHGIRVKASEHHIMLDYHMKEVKWSEPYGYACRGLVLNKHDLSVACAPMTKFFNSGEGYAAPIDWKTAKVFEKMDGTMVCRWKNIHTGEFEYTTRYQLPGDTVTNKINDTGVTWLELIKLCIGELHETLDQQDDETLVFEVMSPVNRVIVTHSGYKCTLLARRNNNTFEEIDLSKHPLAPKTFSFSSQDETEEFAKQLKGLKSEGFVVVDANHNRIKIKGPDYVRLHHLKDVSTNSMKALIGIVRTGETSEVESYFEEYVPAMEAIKKIIEEFVSLHEAAYEKLKNIVEQKDFALAVQAANIPNPGLLYSVRVGKADSIKHAMDELTEPQYIRAIKPLVEKAGITLISVPE